MKSVRIVLGLAAVLGLAGAGMWGAWKSVGAGVQAQAEKRYRRIEELGVPLDADQFAASLRVPAEQNNAPGLTKALVQIKKVAPPGSPTLPNTNVGTWTADDWRKIERELGGAVGKALDDIVQNSSKAHFRIERDWSYPYEVLFPEFSHFKTAAKFLGNRARLHARAGRRVEALADIRRAVHLGELSGETPVLISQLVQTAIFTLNYRSIADCIQLDPAGVDAYREVIEQGERKPIGFALRGEVYFSVGMLRNTESRDMIVSLETEVKKPKTILRRGLPKNLNMLAATNRVMGFQIALLEQLDPEGNVRNVAKFDEVLAELAALDQSKRPEDVIPTAFLPVYASAIRSYRRCDQNRVLHLAFARVVEFRNQQDRWPKSLAEAGVTDLDQMATPAKPMGYRADERGFRVWSVGRDGQDDGGTSQSEWREKHPKSEESRGDDVVVFAL